MCTYLTAARTRGSFDSVVDSCSRLNACPNGTVSFERYRDAVRSLSAWLVALMLFRCPTVGQE